MRVSKDGKLKLSKDERQYGNFVFKNEEEHVKICDINSNLTHRVSKSLNIGQMLSIALKEKQTKYLENYASLVWMFSNIVTDEQFFLDIDRVCGECINRHPELYGIKPNISTEEDAEILQESKEVYEAIEELKKEE
jgi:hypothetical protein